MGMVKRIARGRKYGRDEIKYRSESGVVLSFNFPFQSCDYLFFKP